MKRTSLEIKKEIEERFGFFPPFFEPAIPTPSILDNLWYQTRTAYVENPLPALFKEKLAALIARYCSVPYCLLCHSSTLRPLGMQSGDILELLEKPPMSLKEISDKIECLSFDKLDHWPEAGSHLEECILYCSVAIYLGLESDESLKKLRTMLRSSDYDHLVLFLAYNKTALTWAEGHPELSYEADKRVIDHLQPILSEEPRLKDFFSNYNVKMSSHQDARMKWLTDENRAYAESETKLRKSLESLLVESELQRTNFESIFMQAPVPLVILEGPQHRVTLVNPLYEKFAGRNVMGKTIAEAFSGGEADNYIPILDEVYNTGKPFIGSDLPVDLPDDGGKIKRFWIDIVFHPLKNSDGKITGIFALIHDVTEKNNSKKAIEDIAGNLVLEQHKLESLFNESPAALALWKGRDMVFEKVNTEYQKIFANRELIGRRIDEALPELKEQGFVELLQNVFDTGIPFRGTEVSALVRTNDEKELKERFYDFSYIQIVDAEGRPYGVFDHAMDVTERVLNRREIQVSKVQLEEERDLRDKFVAALSHDLRTPLSSAKMSAQILSRQIPEEFRKHSNRINENMNRADRMIRDILDASRVKVGEKIHLEIGKSDILPVVKDVIEELTILFGDRFILSAPESLTGAWDASAVKRILENLGSNAAKYGAISSKIKFVVSNHGKTAEFCVHNFGNTIPENDLASIFLPYKRSVTAMAQKGWGVGLMLVRGLAEAHGGHVGVTSSEGEGTTFKVILPKGD